jgi:energy-coupling factor transporter ATP-binding protein EcfA2
MPSILSEIRQWANTLPYWEQAALHKLLAGVQFTEADYDELLQYLLEDEDLESPSGPRPQLQFGNFTEDIFQSLVGPIQLVRMFNMQNINALVPGQTLTFCPTLTAIFGATGSGKSGYARVLGCAGFTRGDRDVLPDVTQPYDDSIVLSADIEVSDGVRTEIINYQIGGTCPKLTPCYVFDSTSVHVHLTGSNTFSFSPAGLSCLTNLASVTDKVRERRDKRIQQCKVPHQLGPLFQGKSKVTEIIDELGDDTNLEELRNTATLTPAGKKRIGELDKEIARLKAKDITEEVGRITQTIEDIEKLKDHLVRLEERLADDTINNIKEAVETYLERVSLAQCLSVDQFKFEYFTQVGNEVWQNFVESAKTLAEAEQNEVGPYPRVDDYCLLCQQHLSTYARDLLIRLWEYLEGEAQVKLEMSKEALKEKRGKIEAIDLNFFNDQSVSYRHIKQHKIELLDKINIFIETCRGRCSYALKIIDSQVEDTMPKLSQSVVAEIVDVINRLKSQRDDLEKQSPAQKITELTDELRSLQHRQILHQNLQQIEAYIQKSIWAKKAVRIGGDTTHITRKYRELFGQLVTERYLELFNKILEDLKHPLKVKVKTKGRKGQTYKQIVVECDPTVPIEEATPDRVLSEGEKRAVALADFLTEVALDTTSCAIILDDPVTSLDLEWRDKIASILVTEAKHRQVIVFTHELTFLYFLNKYADQMNVKIATHWIKRGDIDSKPGYVFLDNSPALEREYRKSTKARTFYQKAKVATAEEQENLLHQGFAALRTSYEAFIVFDLFNEVVLRFDERISFGRLSGIVWNEPIVNDVISKCERLSKYIEGHLHSEALIEGRLTCETLLQEIGDFDGLKKQLSKLKKVTKFN